MTDPTPPTAASVPRPLGWCLALLVVEGLLWLSERYRWFGFNEHKGWTVLIAVAAVGVAMLVMLLWFIACLLFHWRFQFTIRSLLLLTVAVALLSGWLAAERERARKQTEAVDRVYACHGRVCWDPQPTSWGPRPREPAWLRSLLGDEFFRLDSEVEFDCNSDIDSGLEAIEGLSQLQRLCLKETRISDVGLERIERLPQLQELILGDSQISDDGLKKLQQALPNCKITR